MYYARDVTVTKSALNEGIQIDFLPTEVGYREVSVDATIDIVTIAITRMNRDGN